MKIILTAIAAVCLTGSALACNDTAAVNALKDAARAQERQAETLRQMERNQRDMQREMERLRQNQRR